MTEHTTSFVRKNRRHLIVTALLIVVAGLFFYFMRKGLDSNPNKIPSALLNKPAKDFTVEWLQGQEFLNEAGDTLDLADLKGRPVILNFWASWCFSCRHEARDFEQFWQKYQDTDLVVAGIAIQDTATAAKDFARQYGKTYVLGLDPEGRVAIDYGVTGVPETFVINRQGEIVHKEAGPVNTKMLKEYAQMIMK
jgi:cytochrome c biogenesis protein CcmG/thiol:disulfide interchange protein DsbE